MNTSPKITVITDQGPCSCGNELKYAMPYGSYETVNGLGQNVKTIWLMCAWCFNDMMRPVSTRFTNEIINI